MFASSVTKIVTCCYGRSQKLILVTAAQVADVAPFLTLTPRKESGARVATSGVSNISGSNIGRSYQLRYMCPSLSSTDVATHDF